jgi:chemotaxis protein CheX
VLLNGVRKAAIAVGSGKIDAFLAKRTSPAYAYPHTDEEITLQVYAEADGAGDMDLESTMKCSLRESVHLIFDPRNLDVSVEEVFRLMLGVNCRRYTGPAEAAEAESVTAVVGFGGLLGGACVFRSGISAAKKIVAHMTGMEFEEVDDTVKDGIGEICNMLAGAWKSKVPDLAANCCLSIPAVITGRDYTIHVQAPEFKLHHTFKLDDTSFEVTIICDSLQ